MRRDGARSPGDTCLVTGASGFIGGHLARRLVEEGYTVRCLVRESSDTSQLDSLRAQLVLGDLTTPQSLSGALEGCRYVFHCAALVSDWATREEIFQTNVLGTHNMLHAAISSSVERFVHLSTTDVYGYPGDAGVAESHTSTRFRNWYAQTKLEAEGEVHKADSGSLDTVILRPATVYGPGSREVVGEIARAIKGRHMLLVAGGRAIAGLCYVDNLLDLAVLALECQAARGQTFNATDGLQVTWREFVDDLAAGLGCPPPRLSLPYWLANGIGVSLECGYRLLRKSTGLTLPALLSRQAVQVLGEDQDFSNSRARETLGWKPNVDYPTGLNATLDWLRSDYLREP